MNDTNNRVYQRFHIFSVLRNYSLTKVR